MATAAAVCKGMTELEEISKYRIEVHISFEKFFECISSLAAAYCDSVTSRHSRW